MPYTRQIRISDADKIKKQIGKFVGKEINLVFTNHTSMVGVLRMVNDQNISVKNMRLKTVTIPFNTIAEIYVDTII